MTPSACTSASTVSGKSHQGLHWDRKREVWEQPRQKLGSRGIEQQSWMQSEGGGAQEQQASPACSPESASKGEATHCSTAGEAAMQAQWTRQLEVWAINEMVAATEEELSRAGVARQQPEAGRHQPEVQQEPVETQVQCPLASAGGVCVVRECEW